MRDEARGDTVKYLKCKEYKKYLIFKKLESTNNYKIDINFDRIDYETRNSGWMIIVGNDLTIKNEEVINIYRNKDVVEKAFSRLKNNLNLNRLRIHNDSNLKSKLFISTISLILNSYINKIMIKNNLYNKYTIDEILLSLEKIQLFKNKDGNKSITPISKTNRDILEFFDIKIT